jgi:hypothetical protein
MFEHAGLSGETGRGGKGGKVKSRKQAIAIGLSKTRKKGTFQDAQERKESSPKEALRQAECRGPVWPYGPLI